MYFQLEADYYSNEVNKNKCTNNLTIAEDQVVQGIVFATSTCHTLLPGLESTLLLGFVVT